MFVTVLLVIIGLLIVGAIGLAVLNPEIDRSDSRGVWSAIAGVLLLIFVVLGAIFSVTAVDARSYGVITAAGKYQETVDSGITFHAPYAKVEEFTTTNKVVNVKKGENPFEFNFKNGGTAYSDIKITYHIKDKEGIENLWREYLTPDKVEDALVTPAGRSTVREEISVYAPFDALKGTEQTLMESTIKDSLNADLSPLGLEVRRVEIVSLKVDDATQNRINQEAQAKADFNRKVQEKANAQVDAQKDVVRKGNASAQDRCLELLRSWNVGSQGPVPVTLNCGLGSSTGIVTGVK